MEKDQRYDRQDHWPESDQHTSRSLCKMRGCSSLTHSYCTKCDIHLCFTKTRNCFRQFHLPAAQSDATQPPSQPQKKNKKSPKKVMIVKSVKNCSQSVKTKRVRPVEKNDLRKRLAPSSACRNTVGITTIISTNSSAAHCLTHAPTVSQVNDITGIGKDLQKIIFMNALNLKPSLISEWETVDNLDFFTFTIDNQEILFDNHNQLFKYEFREKKYEFRV